MSNGTIVSFTEIQNFYAAWVGNFATSLSAAAQKYEWGISGAIRSAENRTKGVRDIYLLKR